MSEITSKKLTFGMTFKEYFAGIAMQTLLAKEAPNTMADVRKLAQRAVGVATALIEELEKVGP